MLTAQIGGHTPQGVPYTRVVSELEDQFQDQFIACAQGFQVNDFTLKKKKLYTLYSSELFDRNGSQSCLM